MSMWFFSIICAIGLTASAATLYSTNQTLRQLQTLRVQRHAAGRSTPAPAADMGAPMPRPAARRSAAPQRTAEPHPDPAQPTTLRLLGTMLERDPFQSLAVIEDPGTGPWRTYRLGDRVGEVRLAAIERGFVLLDGEQGIQRIDLELASDGENPAGAPDAVDGPAIDAEAWRPVADQVFASPEALNGDQAGAVKQAIIAVSETEHLVNRLAVRQAIGDNPLQVLREATLRPAFGAGGLIGVKLAALPEDGILKQSGFQPGDVIRAVNGQPVTDPQAILQMPGHLLRAELVEVQVERNGQPLTLTYRLQ